MTTPKDLHTLRTILNDLREAPNHRAASAILDAEAALQAYISDLEKRAWAKGWADRSAAEDYTDIIGRLRATKPQDGAFFLIGEIEQVVKDLIAQRTRLKGETHG